MDTSVSQTSLLGLFLTEIGFVYGDTDPKPSTLISETHLHLPRPSHQHMSVRAVSDNQYGIVIQKNTSHDTETWFNWAGCRVEIVLRSEA